MNAVKQLPRGLLDIVLIAAAIALIGHAGAVLADEITVALSGNQEIPPNSTSETRTSTFTVGPGKS